MKKTDVMLGSLKAIAVRKKLERLIEKLGSAFFNQSQLKNTLIRIPNHYYDLKTKTQTNH